MSGYCDVTNASTWLHVVSATSRKLEVYDPQGSEAYISLQF